MTAEVGHFSLILALAIAIAQAILPQIGAWRRDLRLITFASYAALSQFLFLGIAFLALVQSFIVSDYSVLLVAEHSNSEMPFFFRLAATWGNHEGSLLLWVLILSIFGAALAVFGNALPPALKARVLAVQATLAAGFMLLTLFTSNPFERLHPAAIQGMELNPLLQDIGLVFHPPFLYLGYVGFSVVFSFAVAGLLEGKVDSIWARYLRPWALASWTLLTIGIALGSHWAYYELGWGGWWFWDPVENASFMPWLVGTALVHSAIVVEHRQTLVVWTLLLSIVTFSLSLVGTFLVRSGILSSVHAFAVDPVRGIGVLLLITVFTGGAFLIYALRSHKLDPTSPFALVSREGGLVLNNILLVVAAATVFLGTFYPLIVEMMGPERISVGAPYFDRTFVPLMLPLLVAAAVGPVLRWKRDRLGDAMRRLRWPVWLTLATIAGAAAWWFATGELGGFGLALGFWLVVASLAIWAGRARIFERDFRRSLRLTLTTPRATWGMVAAHAGLGLFVIGVTAVSTWQQEAITTLATGKSLQIAGYQVRLDKVTMGNGPNYQAERGYFTVNRGGGSFGMESEKRFYPVSRRVTTEAGIRPLGLTNLYIALGDQNNDGSYVVRIYYHPLVLLIWLGPALMALGGILSISDRRFRVGAPERRAASAPLAAGA